MLTVLLVADLRACQWRWVRKAPGVGLGRRSEGVPKKATRGIELRQSGRSRNGETPCWGTAGKQRAKLKLPNMGGKGLDMKKGGRRMRVILLDPDNLARRDA